MGYESMLADIKSSLNGKISDVEDKIEKLKKQKGHRHAARRGNH